jgi:hypothetical protein
VAYRHTHESVELRITQPFWSQCRTIPDLSADNEFQMRKTLLDEPSVQTFLSLAQMQSGRSLRPEIKHAETPEQVLERTLDVAAGCEDAIRQAYARCFPQQTSPKVDHVQICDVVITTELHQAKPPPHTSPPPPIPRRDPIEIWFRTLTKDVAFVLFFNDRDVEGGRPALMGGLKLCDASPSKVAVDKCRMPEGYNFNWGTLSSDNGKLGYFIEENPREFGSGDPPIAIALDRNGKFLSSNAYARPTNRQFIKLFERKVDGTPDDVNADGTPKQPVSVSGPHEGEHLDNRPVKFEQDKIQFQILFAKDYSPSHITNEVIGAEDAAAFMGLARGLIGEIGANATLTFPLVQQHQTHGQQPQGVTVSTSVKKRDVDITEFPPKIKGSPDAYTELKVQGLRLNQLLQSQLAFSCWANPHGKGPGNNSPDQFDQPFPIEKFVYPDLDKVSIGGTKLADSLRERHNPRQVESLSAETAKALGVVLDRQPCNCADDDERLDGPRTEKHRIHLPAGFLKAEDASLKGWQVEVGYHDENNKWIGNVQRVTLDQGASSKAMTLELDVEYPRAIRRRGGQAIELRVYAPNNAPAKAYMLSLQSFEYDPAIVAK